MKKIIYTAAVAVVAALTVTSCGNGDKENVANDTLVSKTLSDSICKAYGEMAGGYVGNELSVYARETGTEYNRREFLQGMRAVIGSKQSDAYIAGLSTGLNILQDIRTMEKDGVRIDRATIIAAISRQILADSLDPAATQRAAETYQRIMNDIHMDAVAREEARRAESPEAVTNIKSGEAFVNKLSKENPDFHTTPDGIGYIISNPGTGDRIVAGDIVTVNYVGRFLDGKVFDQGNDKTWNTGNGLIPGFVESLELLAKGGKGTFYIPGKLAYGVNGAPQAGIGPMQMLVFDIEVTNVVTAAEAAQARAIPAN